MLLSRLSELSVVLITKNEADNIERCLRSLPEAVEIVIVDSQSQDNTIQIAESFGAKVYQREFTNFAEQKNYAISKATRPWILSMDADEELDGDGAQVLSNIIAKNQDQAYRLEHRLVFMGKELRFGKTKDAPLRLFKKNAGQFVGSIHEELRVGSSEVKRLSGLGLKHYSYRDLSDYFARFNRYTTSIASKHKSEGRSFSMVSHLLRPWGEFVSRYFFRLGFLDGYAGYTYALISSLYAYIKYAKLIELDHSHD